MKKATIIFTINLLSFLTGLDAKAQSLIPSDNLISISQNLIDFSGITQNNMISLTWRTISRSEKEFFIIQRSKDGIDWTDIGKASSNSQPNSFLFADNNPAGPMAYYRLKIEHEGHLEYSSLISVKFNSEINKTIVYPNPTRNVIWIKSEQTLNKDIIDLEVYNILGERIYASKMQDQIQNVDLSGYQDGYYCIKIGNQIYKVLKE